MTPPPDVYKLKANMDINGLIKAMGYLEDDLIRVGARARLSEIGAPAVGPLISAINDKDFNIRINAIRALGEIRDSRAVDPLIGVLQSNVHPNLRYEAIGALGKLKDKRAVGPLYVALDDKEKFIREAALDSLKLIAP
ncbi:MAG: HEAT repeat domain-containing protein [Methanomicrobiales archaeon]|nr:HEAT repeat domain-containing protein [Methanomicrobiales archaeon]